MNETQEDMEFLQKLLDQSIEKAGSFVRNSFQMPECSLSAKQLVRYLQGIHTVAFATVTAKGEPRVAPISSLFFRGHFYIPTVVTAARTKQVMKHPAVSLTHFAGNDLAIIVHGDATVMVSNHLDFQTLESLFYAESGSKVSDWGEGVYLRVEAHVLYTFARHPEQYSGQ